jgi:hypothetical protein
MSAKLPWMVLAAVTVTLPAALGTPPLDIVRYIAYILYAVVIPGALLYRAIRPAPRSLLEDPTHGTVVGLLAETARPDPGPPRVAVGAAGPLDARRPRAGYAESRPPTLTDLAWQRGDIAAYRLRATSNCTPVSCSDSVQSR